MAVEVATLIVEYSPPIAMTVTNSTGIEKGALLTLSDPFTAALCTTSGAAHAGIAKNEKIASDGITKLAVHRDGIFKAAVSGAIVVGEAVQFDFEGKICACLGGEEHQAGVALETRDAAGADGVSALFELKPTHVNIA